MSVKEHPGNSSHPKWWRQAVVYQIYPRSFMDANGDGIGDIVGITSKIPYLKELGVDAIWMSPFYPSALKDGGYDVADYRDVDPKIGTLADFDEMMSKLKEAGIKCIVDIVPNHSSDDHVWFQEALKAEIGSKERDRYIFRDGLGEDKSQPPSDWTSLFGGSAWEPVGDGQFYLHLFDTSQPDFNWDNQEVQDDFIKTLRFWADRGVAGFRVDVAHGLAKDLSFPLSSQAHIQALHMQSLENGAELDMHPLWDREDVHKIYKEWRKVFNEYDPPLTAVAEAWVAPDRKTKYASPEGLGQSFSFDMLMCNFARDDFKETIDKSMEDAKASGASTTWVFSNHDVVRHATRYGLEKSVERGGQLGFVQFCRDFLVSRGTNPVCDYVVGLARARAATLLLLALPGSAYIYQGEELGLPEVADIKDEDRQDPTFFRNNGEDMGRDGCRVPIPWEQSSKNFGFGNGKIAHIPQPEWMAKYAVDVEDKDQESTLNMYRKALHLRRELQSDEEMTWVNDESHSLHFSRPGGWEIVLNFNGEECVEVPKGELLIASGPLKDGKIPINTAVWVKSA